jgi:amidophosphoribosyltransferase
MVDQIHHECGIALVRLRKPLDYYEDHYGTPLHGLHVLKTLMNKMRNRGQDGAGMATIKLNVPPGNRFLSRKRDFSRNNLRKVWDGVFKNFEGLTPSQLHDGAWLKTNMPYTGEVLLGHLRYGTHGGNNMEQVHPFHRQNNWITRNVILAGNFNLTNVDELFETLIELGQHPKQKLDTVTILEKIGHFLDEEVESLASQLKKEGYTKREITEQIFDLLDVSKVLCRAAKKFDGGYVMGGMIGHGDAFIMRDPHGIRPCYYYVDDEFVVAASERPAIQAALNKSFHSIQELPPGHVLVVKHNGSYTITPFTEPQEKTSCSFERIYFSRHNDREIYLERKKLGYNLAQEVLESIDYDLDNTVFSFIPNTAEQAFYGLIEGIHDKLNTIKAQQIVALGAQATQEAVEKILAVRPRAERIADKTDKQRTFITPDIKRSDLINSIYDITFGLINDHVDTLVIIDDSIVRGSTLRQKIIAVLARLKPKRIVVVSSAPQIRYPDCYGIDMSIMGEFVAFQALVSLLREQNKTYLLDDMMERCQIEIERPASEVRNLVTELYSHFTYDQITDRIAQMITPDHIAPEVKLIYQTLDGLHAAVPNHTGDWYFSGRYPTPGGNRVAIKAFMLYMQGKKIRAY